MTTATSGKEEAILVLELVLRSCTFWRSIHIHINHSKLEMGGISKKNRVFVANISDECIIGLDTMRMLKMILDVGKGVVGVN